MEQKFFVCEICGNMVGLIKNGGGKLVCCGTPMKELQAGTSDGAKEKHVPVVKVDGSKVTVEVGEVSHPMEADHYIEWIYIKTKKGGHRIALSPGDAPKAEFIMVDGDEFVAAYEYCNKHGLFMA